MSRISGLDDLRAILAWWVVAIHCRWISGHKLDSFWMRGDVPVNAFIALSGYVICRLLITKRESFGTFIVRRWFRLFPAFFVCLIFAILVRPLTVGQNAGDAAREASESAYYWQHLAVHLSMMHGIAASWLPWSAQAFLVPAWSISVEWQLYMLAPLAVWIALRFPRRGVYVMTILAMLPLRHLPHDWTSDPFITQKFFFFWLGGLAALYLNLSGKGIQQRTKPSMLANLGTMSYSTYLIHFPLIALVHTWLPTNDPWLLLAVSAPFVLAASVALYLWIELPGIALGKRLLTLAKTLPLLTPQKTV